jgi:methanogenic corrinoid protein MtbC1
MEPLTVEGRAAAELLARKASLAQAVTDALYTEMPELTSRYGAVGRQRCLEDIRYTIDHLIPAIDLAQPSLFATYVRWLDYLLRSRNVPTREVIRSLELVERNVRNGLPSDQADTVTACIRAGLDSLGAAKADDMMAVVNPSEHYSAYLGAIRTGDRRRAFQVIDDARGAGLDLAAIYLGVFQPALREIGGLWQNNEITVAEEHLATAITQAAMARVYERAFTWRTDTSRTLIAACADVERHEVGLRMLCDLLDLEGWHTTYLGATVPVESLTAMVQRLRPNVVALSAALSPHLPRLRAMIDAIHVALGDARPLIIVGGRPFLDGPSLAQRLGADLTAENAVDAVRLLGERVHRSR